MVFVPVTAIVAHSCGYLLNCAGEIPEIRKNEEKKEKFVPIRVFASFA